MMHPSLSEIQLQCEREMNLEDVQDYITLELHYTKENHQENSLFIDVFVMDASRIFTYMDSWQHVPTYSSVSTHLNQEVRCKE